MGTAIISLAVNVILVIAFIIDRLFRIYSIKEYKEAKEEIIKSKEAQIALLEQQLEFVEKQNDDFITERFKKRAEDLKEIIITREAQIEIIQKEIDELKLTKTNENKEKIENFKTSISSIYLEKQFYSKFLIALHKIRKPAATLQGLMELKKEQLISDIEFAELMTKTTEELSFAVIDAIRE